jgi:hypothetical protein
MLSGQRGTATTCRFTPPLDYLGVAGGDEFAVLLRARLIVLPGELHRFGGESGQLNEIGVLQGLDVDVSVHGGHYRPLTTGLARTASNNFAVAPQAAFSHAEPVHSCMARFVIFAPPTTMSNAAVDTRAY